MALFEVFRSKLLSKLLYGSQAWSGFASKGCLDRIDHFLNKSKKFGYCSPTILKFDEICERDDDRLFEKITNNSSHVLYKLLPDVKKHDHDLRKREHNFILPHKDNRNFLNRLLFKNIY